MAAAILNVLKTLSVNSMRIIEIKTIESVTAFFGHIFSFHSDYYYGYDESERAWYGVWQATLPCVLENIITFVPLSPFTILSINAAYFFLLLSLGSTWFG